MTQSEQHSLRTGNGSGSPGPVGWTFFRQWLRHPLSIAAISPSSRQLARQMIAELPEGARRVIELGGGTGVITQALLGHGITPGDLLVIEINEELHHHLRHRFPGVRLACADARALVEAAERSGFSQGGLADAVVSGLGFLSMPRSTQREILDQAFAVLSPEGRFIQFTYGPTSPIAREVLDDLHVSMRRANFTWWNMPPASVYVYSRSRSRAVKARRMR